MNKAIRRVAPPNCCENGTAVPSGRQSKPLQLLEHCDPLLREPRAVKHTTSVYQSAVDDTFGKDGGPRPNYAALFDGASAFSGAREVPVINELRERPGVRAPPETSRLQPGITPWQGIRG
jgi:hypothetical protein